MGLHVIFIIIDSVIKLIILLRVNDIKAYSIRLKS